MAQTFIMYINQIIREQRQMPHENIQLSGNVQLDSLLSADNLVLLAFLEEYLNKIVTKYDMTINIQNTEIMAFGGKYPVPSIFCIK